MNPGRSQAADAQAIPTLSDLVESGAPRRREDGSPRRIALAAGEASGDALGAGLIQALRREFPDAEFAGIGGDAMRDAGCTCWHDAHELAVMGLAEVLRHLPRLLRLRRRFRERVLAWQPDVFIGIDAPDFNLGVERWLKQRGIRTVHYVSPSVWAWRESRAQKIGASASTVLCLFPMEPAIYARYGIDARFVGHPMADEMAMDPDQAGARNALRLYSFTPVLAVLPGSRVDEVQRLGPTFLQAARRVAEDVPYLQIVIPAANSQCRRLLEPMVAAAKFRALPPIIIDGRAREAMVAADVVLLASGTATLEAMLAKRGMVVGYKVAPLTYRIVKMLGMLKSDRYALPNVLSGTDLAPELMQDDCTVDNVAAAVINMFQHPDLIGALQPTYRELHETLRRGASIRAADAIARLLR